MYILGKVTHTHTHTHTHLKKPTKQQQTQQQRFKKNGGGATKGLSALTCTRQRWEAMERVSCPVQPQTP